MKEAFAGNPFLEKRERMLRAVDETRKKREEFEQTYPKILDRQSFRKEQAPKLKSIPIPTISELLAREQATLPEVIEKFGIEMTAFEEELRKGESSVDDERFPLFDTLYALYKASNEGAASEDEREQLNHFRSRDAFLARFCPEATPYSRAWITRYIQAFIEQRIHPERTIRTSTRGMLEGANRDIYTAKGEWVLMPEKYFWGHSYEYADKQVIEAAVELLEKGYRRPDFSHTTASAALEGIAQHGAILSTQEILKKGLKPATGEFTSQVGRETGIAHDMFSYDEGFGRGLGSVYASRGEVYYGYHTLHWFDEYRVSFGINKQQHEESLKVNPDKARHDRGIEDWGSEGVMLGSEVSLESVELVAAPMQYLEEVKTWAQKACPHARVYPVEALELLRSEDETMGRVAIEEGINPAEAWKNLTKTAERIL
jgi:hypothetical protein